jgi:hypothetical protein
MTAVWELIWGEDTVWVEVSDADMVGTMVRDLDMTEGVRVTGPDGVLFDWVNKKISLNIKTD